MVPGMVIAHADALLSEARAALLEAHDLLEGAPSGAPREDGVLGLYDELRERLKGVDDERVRDLLDGVGSTIERLVRLAEEVERLRALRRVLKNGR